MVRPTFSFERKLWKKYPIVIGIDEVGRGAVAGPVATGAVVFKKYQVSPASPSEAGRASIKYQVVKIDDSKRLRPKEREKSAKWIKKNCLAFALGSSPVSYINKYGIVKATHRAFRTAVKELLKKINKPGKKFLLVDAFYIKYVKGIGLSNQKAIVKGDQRSISIAAASIVAKVHRDKLMKRLSQKRGIRFKVSEGVLKKSLRRISYKKYSWHKNKGYATADHLGSIKKYGLTTLHRVSFLISSKGVGR